MKKLIFGCVFLLLACCFCAPAMAGSGFAPADFDDGGYNLVEADIPHVVLQPPVTDLAMLERVFMRKAVAAGTQNLRGYTEHDTSDTVSVHTGCTCHPPGAGDSLALKTHRRGQGLQPGGGPVAALKRHRVNEMGKKG